MTATNATKLSELLLTAVPLHIQAMQESGGLTPDRLQWLQSPAVQDVMERADVTILFGGTAEGFNTLAKAIALLSFVPGGITLFGTQWNATKPFPFWGND